MTPTWDSAAGNASGWSGRRIGAHGAVLRPRAPRARPSAPAVAAGLLGALLLGGGFAVRTAVAGEPAGVPVAAATEEPPAAAASSLPVRRSAKHLAPAASGASSARPGLGATGSARGPELSAASRPADAAPAAGPAAAARAEEPAPEACPAAASAPAEAPARTRAPSGPPDVRIGKPTFLGGGNVPLLVPMLTKARDEVAQCVATHGGLAQRRASLSVEFLVRARGRAEGVGIASSHGVSAEARRCVRKLLQNRWVGMPSVDPVGVAVRLSLRATDPVPPSSRAASHAPARPRAPAHGSGGAGASRPGSCDPHLGRPAVGGQREGQPAAEAHGGDAPPRRAGGAGRSPSAKRRPPSGSTAR